MTARVCYSLTAILVGAIIIAMAGCSDNPTESSQRLMSLSTYSLGFSSWAGQHPDPAQLKVTVMMDGVSTNAWTAAVESDWVRIGPRGTDTIFVSVVSDTLPAGDYYDTVEVAVPASENSPQLVLISLSVRNRITISHDSLIFVGLGGGENPAPQLFVVSDYEGENVRYEATASVGWLGLEPTSGVVPGSLTVSPDISGLAAGQYLGEIVVTSPDLPQSQAILRCRLNLSSWNPLEGPFISSGVNFESIQFSDSQVGYASGWTPSNSNDPRGLVYRTIDGGANWTKVLERNPTKFGGLAVQDADRCWVVGDAAWVEYSTNGGGDWVKSENLPLDSTLDLARVTFVGYLHGWIIGDDGVILHTENNGLNWTLQSTPTDHNLADQFFIDEQTGWVAGNHGTILHTTNAGTTWIAQDPGLATDLRAIWFIDNMTGWVVGSSGTALQTDDGGITWAPVDIGSSKNLLDMYFASASKGWIVGLNGEIHHTNDGGLSWLQQPTELNDETLTSVYFHNDNIGWVAGSSGTILSTMSGGF